MPVKFDHAYRPFQSAKPPTEEACPMAYSSFWASIEEDAETTVRQITLPT